MRAPKRDIQPLRLRHISRLPAQLSSEEAEVYTERPPWAVGDDTAFAILTAEGDGGPFWPRNTIIYLTRRRDPILCDLVLLDMKNGQSLLRILEETKSNAFVFTVPVVVDRKIVKETIKFSDINEMAVVSGTRRNT